MSKLKFSTSSDFDYVLEVLIIWILKIYAWRADCTYVPSCAFKLCRNMRRLAKVPNMNKKKLGERIITLLMIMEIFWKKFLRILEKICFCPIENVFQNLGNFLWKNFLWNFEKLFWLDWFFFKFSALILKKFLQTFLIFFSNFYFLNLAWTKILFFCSIFWCKISFLNGLNVLFW